MLLRVGVRKLVSRRFRSPSTKLARLRATASVVLLCALATSCGSRSSLRAGDDEDDGGGFDVIECTTDAECATDNACEPAACELGHCVPLDPVVCEASEPCQVAACDPETGACVSEPVTPDLDGDGHHAPLPGFLPGEPGSCGDDCDDTRPAARPGGQEVCDGVDNDCDGVIDNGQRYLMPLVPRPLLLASEALEGSGGAGIAFGDGLFATSYGGRTDAWRSYLRGVGPFGEPRFDETLVSSVNVMSFGAEVVWTGEAFAAAWADPRLDGNYEIYFARFSASGAKLGPDLRVTDAPDFSLHPDMIQDAGRLLVVYDDRRDRTMQDAASIFGRVLDPRGTLTGSEERLTPPRLIAEYPSLAAGTRRLGLAFTILQDQRVGLGFRIFDKNLGDGGPVISLAEAEVIGPRVTAIGDRFVVTWGTYGAGPGPSVMAAVLSDRGDLLVPPRPITTGARFARSHTTVALGDRFILLWADDRDGNYELYAKALDASLTELEARTRLTFDDSDTLSPEAALSDNGRLGVVFDDWRTGAHQSYFTALGCNALELP